MDKKNDKIKYADSYYNMQKYYDKLYDLSVKNISIKNLMEIIMMPDNIKLAYRNIKSNKGSRTPGYDKKTIKYIENMKEENFVKHMQNKLSNYNPMPVRKVYIPKSNGKMRGLGIPTIEDRIIQQSIKQVIEPICEAKFHKHSYGFRPNRDTSNAIFRVQHLINNCQLHYCVDLDIKSFFDEVNHGKLIKQIWSIGIQDKRLIKVISKMIKFEVDGQKVEKGTPQGGIISPLLANIVLNEFDWWISNQYETQKLRESEFRSKSWKFKTLKNKTNLKEMYIIRYADDIKIMCRDYITAVKILEASKKWLKERLKLEVSNEKTKIVNLRKNYTDFLGIKIKAQKKNERKISATSKISNKSKREIKNKIRESIKKIKKYNDSRSAYNYNLLVLGIHNYYSRATNVFKDMKEIHYRMIPVLRNALRRNGSYGYHRSSLYSLDEKYFKKGTYKTWKLCKIPLIPICDVQYKTNKAFKQTKCNYTVEGRKELNYEKLFISDELESIKNESIKNENIKLHDNKISKFSMQKGLCEVSKIKLTEGNREIHHKTPRCLGGNDNFSNICWLNYKVHKLIHIENEDLINQYFQEVIKESKEEKDIIIKRINKLRKLADKKEISLI